MHRAAGILVVVAWLAELTYLVYLHLQTPDEPLVIHGVQITLVNESSVLVWETTVLVGLGIAVYAFFARRRWELLVFACAGVFFAGWFAFGYWGGGPVNAYALQWRVAQHFGGVVAAGFYLRNILIPLALSSAAAVAACSLLRSKRTSTV